MDGSIHYDWDVHSYLREMFRGQDNAQQLYQFHNEQIENFIKEWKTFMVDVTNYLPT